MSIKSLLNQFKLGDEIVTRLGDVLLIATEHGDTGVVDWVHVAMTYAINGKLRDRDLANLTRLEETYNSDYYRGPSRISGSIAAFA